MKPTATDRPCDGVILAPWRTALLAGAAALFALATLGSAQAQGYGAPGYGNAKSKANRSVAINSKKSVAAKKDVPIRHPFGETMPKGPLQLVVSISDQRAILYSNGARVAETKISTGTASHPTPTGIFSIIQKNRWHRSNLYGNAPMFYMHRLTWSGIALHEGHLPGFAASHGCIRMPTDFVSRLWNVSRLGMRVVVARVELTPQDVSHAKLFQPAQKPVDNSRTSERSDALRPSLATVGRGWVRVAQLAPAAEDLYGPTDVPGAGIDAGNAGEAVTGGADVSAMPLDSIDPAAAPHAADAASAAPVPDGEPATTATVVPAPVEGESARSPQADVVPVAPAGAEPERPAVDPQELLPKPAPLRTRTAEPAKQNGQLAVFISGKEKRIFVRHSFQPLFDMPIEIANPSKPLGTHTFTALELIDQGRMRWNLVSMPLTASQPSVATATKKGTPTRAKAPRGAVITPESSTAGEALDRVTIPQAAAERIAELLTPGSSLIISDEGLGRETGRYTEFIVETR
ncbi:MAG: L,D-transpeptidase family protein [Hyphomicrobiales bacterium]|nr:L,D-transpeptidase family protein [Hyphomicrobiales bacterium]